MSGWHLTGYCCFEVDHIEHCYEGSSNFNRKFTVTSNFPFYYHVHFRRCCWRMILIIHVWINCMHYYSLKPTCGLFSCILVSSVHSVCTCLKLFCNDNFQFVKFFLDCSPASHCASRIANWSFRMQFSDYEEEGTLNISATWFPGILSCHWWLAFLFSQLWESKNAFFTEIKATHEDQYMI
jgi:hypothetical protein